MLRTVFFTLIATIFFAHIQAQSDALLGVYLNSEGSAKIEIFKCDDVYCGKIVWLEDPGLDENNPDPALRDRPVEGLVFMTGFSYKQRSNDWRGGKVYASDNGNTYSGKMWLKNNNEMLMMRGYVGVSLLGRTEEFTRIKE